MFTGLVEEMGEVARVEDRPDGRLMWIDATRVLEDAEIGHSIAVNGCCLTVTAVEPQRFSVELVPETLRRTTLGQVSPGDAVNLERSLRLDQRLGGHLVQGHIDGVATVRAVAPEGEGRRLAFDLPGNLAPYVAEKGSIAIDGVSLTVARVGGTRCEIALIPHTLEVTIAGRYAVGTRVNIEVDLMARYLARLLEQGGIDQEDSMKARSAGAKRTAFIDVSEAVRRIRAGRMIIVVDDAERENEGDLVFAAEKATADMVNFAVKHGRGILCAPMTPEIAGRLELRLMVNENTAKFGTPFTESVDARRGTSTGTSAFDRARTLRVLADPRTRASDLVRPGHVFPLRAVPGGVLRRAGHTEAAPDLCVMAGLHPVAAVCEILREDGRMARLPDLERFAREHALGILTIQDLIAHRRKKEMLVRRLVTVPLPTPEGRFQLHLYESRLEGDHHVALVKGRISSRSPVLVRVHSQCLTGDVFGSQRCDCGSQLHSALRAIHRRGRGVLLYLRQEGRGIGLAAKLQAYALQDQGLDTVEANVKLGYPADLRDYGIGAQILVDLGVREIQLLTNNPRKLVGLEAYGLRISERVPIHVKPNRYNRRYLATKRDKLGHLLDLKLGET